METSTSQLLSIPSLVTGEPTEAEEYFLAQENAGWLEKKWHRAAAVTTNDILEQFSRGPGRSGPGLPACLWARNVQFSLGIEGKGEGRESIFQRR